MATAAEEGLAGATDEQLIEACRAEGRCLVTLDLDFSNPFRFPPEATSGIAVIRLPRRPTLRDLDAAVGTLCRGLERDTVVGKLWIVERGRIREYLAEAPDDPPPSE